ncbi:MAG: hypothetical protein NTV52_03515 [Acidobacteria bacterium]|nr:hypothetical protein [Acidobacteriota bacterium]
MPVLAAPTSDERRAALREVLDSQAFARSEQLKNFLRYVCELDIGGRAAEIKEYSIGVEALGRPSSYSPANDSSVRRRAFELRTKLAELYAKELAASPVVIELPKGSYVPVFRFRGDSVAEVPASRPTLAIAAALVAGLLLGAGAMRFLAPTTVPPDIVKEAWGPLATPQGSVLMCVASNFHLAVRLGNFSSESDLPTFPAPEEIYPLYQKSNPMPERGPLFMRPALNTTTLGVVGAIAAASSTLRAFGAQFQILPERTAPLASFRNRNVILYGDATSSFAATKLLSRGRLAVVLDAATGRLVIRDRTKPLADPPAFSRREAKAGDHAEVYGLLTVLPSDAEPGQQRRTLIVSGVSNVGTQGAMEFFTSPDRLTDLKGRFRRDGLAGFPTAYQVVVKCTAEDNLPLSCGYAGHVVLD